MSKLCCRIRAYDAGQNISESSATTSATTAADTLIPSTPQNFTLGAATVNSLTLSWSASTDNVGVAGYKIDVATDSSMTAIVSGYNNKDVENVLTTSITGLSPQVRYYTRVRAYDAAGNVSTNSGVISATTLTDTSAPTVASNVNLSKWGGACNGSGEC